MAGFPGIGHVAITVTDLGKSTAWYKKLLGSDPVLDEDESAGYHHTVWALDNGGLFGIHGHKATDPNDRFSEFRVGLDHVAFAVDSRAQLEDWQKRLDDLGIEHGGIKDASYGSGISFRDPDNNALEFFAPPS